MIKFLLTSLLMIVLGIFSISIGIIKGRLWAVEYINSSQVGSIEQREGILNAFLYIPMIFGSFLIVFAIIIFAVVFNNWTKKYL